MSMKNAFLVTKPIQYLIVMCIIRDLQVTNYKIIIINSFFDAKNFFIRLKTYNKNVYFYENKNKAYNYIINENIDNLYTDSDVGYKNHIDLKKIKKKNKNIKINVYEEGTGTYEKMYSSLLKNTILRLLGIATSFGASKYVDSIFLYNIDKYKSKFNYSINAVEIKSSVQEELSLNLHKYNFIFDCNVSNTKPLKEKAILYLENKNEIFKSDFFKRNDCDVFIKKHPATFNSSNKNCNDSIIINTGIPAELAIVNLLDLYKEVTIYSFNSSTSLYVKSSSAVFVNLYE